MFVLQELIKMFYLTYVQHVMVAVPIVSNQL